MRDTKARIIAAAAKVAVERGVQNMTMDAVATEAGISKGGVFYHFGSKHDLLLGMVQALVNVTEQAIETSQVTDDGAGSWLRGFVKASIARDAAELGSVGQLSVAFLTAAANDTTLLKPMNDKQAEWRKAINESGLDPTTAQIVRLAADGLWINDVMHVPVLDLEQRKAVVDRLMMMTRSEDRNSMEGEPDGN